MTLPLAKSQQSIVSEIFKDLGLDVKNLGACGKKWNSEGGELLSSTNPTTGEVLARIHCATDTDYETVVADAESAQLKWRETPAPLRGDVIRQLGNAFREYKEPLGKLISLEMGKVLSEGLGEVQEAIDICDFAVGLSRQLCGSTMHSERPGHRMYEQWHPLGTIGIITAFNFPCAVWAWNASLAAVCGNAMVWKPSEKTPLVAIAMQHITNKVLKGNNMQGLMGLVISVDRTLGERMVDDKRMKLISATGSVPMGRAVGQNSAKRFAKCLLELGGNNAMIIMDDADLDMAMRAVTFGAVGTAGQRCTTTRRVLAHIDIIDDLITNVKKAYASVKIGDPLAEGVLMGPLIDELSVDAYEAAIEEAINQGGEVVYGGQIIEGEGSFVEPTIIRADKPLPIMQTETFAPILYIVPIKNLDEAIDIQNDVPQGLSSSIFTLNMQNAEKFLSAMGSDCGIANVNIGTSGAEIGGAFGGEKETGGGRESGSDAWRTYMRRQTCTINWSKELPLAQGVKFDT
ncbi:MAG: aldehyde dehydrogenase (NAD+) [Alphaproteobacteria bacterium]|jgi:aldehyde dehydrogenase (NAD+)